MVRKAYENWNHVIEYDGKILGSHGKAKPGMKSSVPPVMDHKHVEDDSGLIEYPFMGSGHLLGTTTFNNPQLALAGSIDYGNPALGSSYFPVDWTPSGEGLEDIVTEEIRLKRTEMLGSDDMRRLLMTLNAGVAHPSDEAACFTYSLQYQPQMYQPARQDREKTSGKAVVGRLKLKEALRWGIFIRRRAAERRGQLYELD